MRRTITQEEGILAVAGVELRQSPAQGGGGELLWCLARQRRRRSAQGAVERRRWQAA
jgi:hypothetical protein